MKSRSTPSGQNSHLALFVLGKGAVLIPSGASGSGKSFTATWAVRHLVRKSLRLAPKVEAALTVLRAFTNIATAEVPRSISPAEPSHTSMFLCRKS